MWSLYGLCTCSMWQLKFVVFPRRLSFSLDYCMGDSILFACYMVWVFMVHRRGFIRESRAFFNSMYKRFSKVGLKSATTIEVRPWSKSSVGHPLHLFCQVPCFIACVFFLSSWQFKWILNLTCFTLLIYGIWHRREEE